MALENVYWHASLATNAWQIKYHLGCYPGSITWIIHWAFSKQPVVLLDMRSFTSTLLTPLLFIIYSIHCIRSISTVLLIITIVHYFSTTIKLHTILPIPLTFHINILQSTRYVETLFTHIIRLYYE
jgi:hypothetical protein